jgi:hypothetical protein
MDLSILAPVSRDACVAWWESYRVPLNLGVIDSSVLLICQELARLDSF